VSDDDDLLKALLEAAPPSPSSAFVDGVMRQVATRPLPRPGLWRRLFAPRQVTVSVRPGAWAVSAAAIAALALVVARPRHAPTVAVRSSPAVTDTPAPMPTIVRFVLAAPKAHAVSLAGDFNGWRPDTMPLSRGADGVWFIQVPLGRGNWSYSFVVDGQFVEDPLAESWRDDGFGGRNAVVRIGDLPVGSARGG
jgi:hypothetical protein